MATKERVYKAFKIQGFAGFSSVAERPNGINGEAGKGKYTVTLIVDKDSPEAKELKRCVAECAKEAFGKAPNKLKGKTVNGHQVPGYLAFKDGDIAKPDRAEYANSYFVTMTSNNQPIPAFEIVNGKPTATGDVRSGYKIVVKGKFASNEYNGEQQVLAWPDAVMVLEKTESTVDENSAASMFGDEIQQYQDTAVDSLDTPDTEDLDEGNPDLDSLDEDWDTEEPPVEPKKVKTKSASTKAATKTVTADVEGDEFATL